MQSLKENQSLLRAPRGSREYRPALSSPLPRLSSWKTSVKLSRARLATWQRNTNCLRSWQSGPITTRVGWSRRRTFCHTILSERCGLLVHFDEWLSFVQGAYLVQVQAEEVLDLQIIADQFRTQYGDKTRDITNCKACDKLHKSIR